MGRFVAVQTVQCLSLPDISKHISECLAGTGFTSVHANIMSRIFAIWARFRQKNNPKSKSVMILTEATDHEIRAANEK